LERHNNSGLPPNAWPAYVGAQGEARAARPVRLAIRDAPYTCIVLRLSAMAVVRHLPIQHSSMGIRTRTQAILPDSSCFIVADSSARGQHQQRVDSQLACRPLRYVAVLMPSSTFRARAAVRTMFGPDARRRPLTALGRCLPPPGSAALIAPTQRRARRTAGDGSDIIDDDCVSCNSGLGSVIDREGG
jgi:hypothetical protein